MGDFTRTGAKTEDINIRCTKKDIDSLKSISNHEDLNISETIRFCIRETYRRQQVKEQDFFEYLVRMDQYHRGKMNSDEQVQLICDLYNSGLIEKLDDTWQRGLDSMVYNGYIQVQETLIGLMAISTGKAKLSP